MALLDGLVELLEDFRVHCSSYWSSFYYFLMAEFTWNNALGQVSRQSVYLQLAAVVLSSLVFICLSVRIWMKLTMGWCKSKARMDGRTVLITGANSGIGFETALNLSRRGARVILAVRNVSRGVEAARRILDLNPSGKVSVREVDLAVMSSVRKFAAAVMATEDRLDVLVLNAGMAVTKKYMTEEGFELHMASNHFGHFLLANLLAPLMVSNSKGEEHCGRIVVVSSLAHKFGNLKLDNLNSEKYYDSARIYANTKLANLLFTLELSRRLAPHKVTVNSLHPGVVQTNLFRNIPFLAPVMPFVLGFWKTAQEGAQTSIHLAVSEDVENVTGKFFADCKLAQSSQTSTNNALATKLWDRSVDILQMEAQEEFLG